MINERNSSHRRSAHASAPGRPRPSHARRVLARGPRMGHAVQGARARTRGMAIEGWAMRRRRGGPRVPTAVRVGRGIAIGGPRPARGRARPGRSRIPARVLLPSAPIGTRSPVTRNYRTAVPVVCTCMCTTTGQHATTHNRHSNKCPIPWIRSTTKTSSEQ